LRQQLQGLRNILVFLIREDAVAANAAATIVQQIRGKFDVLSVEELDDAQIRSVTRGTRGGDWIEHRGANAIDPRIAVICHDRNPIPVDEDSVLARKHIHVTNENAFFKHQLRTYLEDGIPDSSHMVFLHGSDNDLESMEYLIAIYGKNALPMKCGEFLQQINALGCSQDLMPRSDTLPLQSLASKVL